MMMMMMMSELRIDKLCMYVKSLQSRHYDLEYWLTEHLRVSGIYWGLTSVQLLGRDDTLDHDNLISMVMSCKNDDGGFGGDIGHDSHILYTLSSVQLLIMLGRHDLLDVDNTSRFVASLQRDNGGFSCDEYGSTDTRFLYCALSCLSLLNRHGGVADFPVNEEKVIDYVLRCQNDNGGFGAQPGAESHAGQTFCCVGALALSGAPLTGIRRDRLVTWLGERQLLEGGINGRVGKTPDVCYAWWVLASLSIIGALDTVDTLSIAEFILSCQNIEHGGFSPRRGDRVDIFHTLFALAGLSLLYNKENREGIVTHLEPVDALYCMPVRCLEGLQGRVKVHDKY